MFLDPDLLELVWGNEDEAANVNIFYIKCAGTFMALNGK